MKVYLPNISEQNIGGGWTFMRNLRRGLESEITFVDDWKECDVYFISGVTLAERDEVEQVKVAGKKIVFRVDNVPKKSRNKRSRVYDNMKRYSELADAIVYQSKWAKMYTEPLITTTYEKEFIIYNGVDTDIFKRGPEREEDQPLRYLFVQFNRDENKRFPEAAYHFHMRHREDPRVTITMVGKFSPDNFGEDGIPHFDFFDNENIEFISPVSDPAQMAEIYADHDVLLFPAYCDAAPNTVLEARACGLLVECVNPVGGTVEMLEPQLDISAKRMCEEYLDLFKKLINL